MNIKVLKKIPTDVDWALKVKDFQVGVIQSFFLVKCKKPFLTSLPQSLRSFCQVSMSLPGMSMYQNFVSNIFWVDFKFMGVMGGKLTQR